MLLFVSKRHFEREKITTLPKIQYCRWNRVIHVKVLGSMNNSGNNNFFKCKVKNCWCPWKTIIWRQNMDNRQFQKRITDSEESAQLPIGYGRTKKSAPKSERRHLIGPKSYPRVFYNRLCKLSRICFMKMAPIKATAKNIWIEKLSEATCQSRQNPWTNPKCQNRLPTKDFDRNRQKPRCHRNRRSAGVRHTEE